MSELIDYRLDGDVAVITLDDGKANALSRQLGCIGQCPRTGGVRGEAVILAGRPGRFSAGFDLKIMMSGAGPARTLLGQGAKVFMRLYGSCRWCLHRACGRRLPHHALRRPAHRDPGAFKLGMNEVAIGMPLPFWLWSWSGSGWRRNISTKPHFSRGSTPPMRRSKWGC